MRPPLSATPWAIEKAAQVWCKPQTAMIPMNAVLAMAFAEVLDEEVSKPGLGLATTKELLDEIAARVDLSYTVVKWGKPEC